MKVELNTELSEGQAVARIIRYAHRKTHTLGLLYTRSDRLPFRNTFQMYTLELPDLNNQRDISRIPEGEYICTPWKSPRHGSVYKILDVKDRGDILIHVGNFKEETEGCVLVGIGQGNDQVIESVKALDKLKSILGDGNFKLIIGNL